MSGRNSPFVILFLVWFDLRDRRVVRHRLLLLCLQYDRPIEKKKKSKISFFFIESNEKKKSILIILNWFTGIGGGAGALGIGGGAGGAEGATKKQKKEFKIFHKKFKVSQYQLLLVHLRWHLNYHYCHSFQLQQPKFQILPPTNTKN